MYVRLNKLRRMREENARRFKKVKSTDVLRMHNDKFDKFTKKLIYENLEISKPENFEGVYFKTHDDYVKYMKRKHTSRVDTLNLDQLYEKLGATYPRYKRDTMSRLIKSLRVTPDEYKVFEKYLLTNKAKQYDNNEICLFEQVVESRLKEILKRIPLGREGTAEQVEKYSTLTWKQLSHLRQSVAHFLQTHSHRAINDKNYDIKDFKEMDPRSKYNPHDSKFYKESKSKTYSLIQKLKDITNILRNIYPESKTAEELGCLYEGYYATLRHKVPPNSKEEPRSPKLRKIPTAKNFLNLIK